MLNSCRHLGIHAWISGMMIKIQNPVRSYGLRAASSLCRRIRIIFVSILMTATIPANSTAYEKVVLLHGLARSSGSMKKMEESLSRADYQVLNIDYPSREYDIPELARMIRKEIVSKTSDTEKVYFVTHSMGGIIVRYIQKNDPLPNIGRVVMLSPPNHGSEVVDALKDIWPFELINGPAGKQLGTDEMSIPQSLGPVNFEAGIITGDRSINWINSLIIPGDDDGKVSVNSAKVDGMADFFVVHVSHPFIIKNEGVISKCISFLKTGHF
jgi:triacylglycerol lipase